MIKAITFLKRHPRLTREEFLDYWLNRHAPLVMSVPEFWRHVRKYRQNHCVQSFSLLDGVPAGDSYDGCAELWFDSVESLEVAVQEPAYLAIIRPDELKFIDGLAGAPMILAVEHVVFDGAV